MYRNSTMADATTAQTSVPPKILPPEVIDHALDFLHDDPTTLQAVALTHSQLAKTSRYHRFFSPLKLSGPSDLSHFMELLTRDGDLAECVKGLHIRSSGTPTRWPEGPRPWILDIPRLLGGENSKVKSIYFDRVHWDQLESLLFTPSLRDAFSAVETLRFSLCEFSSFSELEAVLLSFPRLSQLSVDHLTWRDKPEDPGFAYLVVQKVERSRVQLESLRIGGDAHMPLLFHWLSNTATLRFNSLSKLQLDKVATEPEATAVGGLLRTLGPQLRELTIGCKFNYNTPMMQSFSDYIDISTNTELRELRLCVLELEPYAIPWVSKILSQLASNHLTKMGFVVWLFAEWQLKPSETWEDIAMMVDVRNLREVEVVHRGMLEISRARRAIENIFPVLAQRRALRVVERPVPQH